MLKNLFWNKCAQSGGALDARTLVMVMVLTLFAMPALFTAAPGLAAETDIQAVVDYAKKQGVQVIIVSPDEQTPQEQPTDVSGLESTSQLLADFEDGISKLLANSNTATEHFAAAVEKASPKSGTGVGKVVAILIGSMVLAFLIERFYLRWLKGKLKQIWPTIPREFAGKMAVVLVRFLGRVSGILLFCILAMIFTALVVELDGAAGLTAVAVVGGVVVARAIIEFWRLWLSPSNEGYRLAALGGNDARNLFRWFAGSAVLTIGLGAMYAWLEHFELEHNTLTLFAVFSTTAVLIFHLTVVAVNRNRVAAIISGANAQSQVLPALNRFLTASWHLPVGAYFIAAWITTVVRLVLDQPNALGLSGGMIIVLLASLALYGVGTVIIRVLFSRRQAPERPSGITATEQTRTTERSDGQQQEHEPKAGDDVPVVENSYELLTRRALALVVVAVAIGATFFLWGAHPLDDESPVVRLWEVIFIAIVGYVAFQVTKISIAKKIAEREALEHVELESKGALSGLSRFATLLPLFRNFTLITIAVITVMIGLSELGVDIAPLFAGAGVIGLAIGFGAQTMVKDIISGAFFLADDAFRIGEYIDTGDANGTVEKINIRSMQIRHYEGLLQTVPFGEIKIVKNWSRDWSLMKLKLRVTYDTDIEKVRRLIKKLGKELMEDPDIGHMFLQPLKSQGVHSMEDSAIIVRVKFTTRPGDQYVVRTKVFPMIRDLFEREGIEFATRQVTVRLADEHKEHELDDNAKKKIAGAVLPVIEEGTVEKPDAAAGL